MVSDNREELNYRHQLVTARHAIAAALQNSCRAVVSTKFSEDSAVFLHLITQMKADIPVIWVDTGYNTRATREFADKLSQRLELNLQTFTPEEHTITFPPELDDPDHAEFTQEVKIEPFQRALRTLQADAWLSSIRRYQSDHRRSLPTFQPVSNGLLKVSPILEWTADTVTRYRLEHDLPEGAPCFDPTKGEPFRECGLHLTA